VNGRNGGKKRLILWTTERYPDKTPTQLSLEAQCTVTYVQKVLRDQKEKKFSVPAVRPENPRSLKASVRRLLRDNDALPKVHLGIELPEGGAELKLTQDGRMIGTLRVAGAGVAFIPANGKTKPEKLMPWNTLKAIQELQL